ncbi:AsmA family protein [Roseococcus sp. DSY-14]|uniref:AsmA family protein n=1 Tax=Roseococcus sp. DSY-14 TaxID=3369650 RepID=UPI00387AADC5
MRRALLIALAALVGLPLLALGAFLALFDADALRPRLEAAVTQATGRPFAAARLSLLPALAPTVTLEGARLGNVEGGSRPEMLLLRRAELTLALWPLLSGRVEVKALELQGGDLLLEAGNWSFARPAAPGPAAPAGPAREPMALDIRAVSLRDWVVTAGGERVAIPRATLAGSGPGQPFTLRATLVARGAEALVEARGDLSGGTGTATLPGARLAGEARRDGTGWTGHLTAEAPRLAELSRLAGRDLPPLTGVTLRAEGGWRGGAPVLASLVAEAGGEPLPGLALDAARLRMTAWDGPAELEARGRFRDQPFSLAGDAVPLALAQGRAAPLALRAEALGGRASVNGAWPGTLALELALPELAPLGALLGAALPPLRDVAAQARVTRRGDAAAGVQGLSVTSSAGDARGDLELGWAPRPSLRGRLESRRLDLGALRPPAAPAPAAAPAVPPPAATPGPARLLPDLPLDLAPLRGFDADLTFSLDELRWNGATYRQVQGRLVNEAGRARLDPFALTLPGGRLSLRMAADATAAPPALQLAGGGQGLDLAALTQGGPVQGRADLDMDIRGQGATTRALAATATGRLGLAVTEGRLAGGWASAVATLVPGAGGAVPLSCGAFRWALDRGVARTETFFLDGAPGRAAGEGTVNLRDETLDARLSVDLRVAGIRVRAPIPVTGTLLAPRLESRGLLENAIAGQAGNQLDRLLPPGLSGQLERIPGLNRALPNTSGPELTDCATALRAARFGRDGPVPATRPAEALREAPRNVENFLRGLLR